MSLSLRCLWKAAKLPLHECNPRPHWMLARSPRCRAAAKDLTFVPKSQFSSFGKRNNSSATFRNKDTFPVLSSFNGSTPRREILSCGLFHSQIFERLQTTSVIIFSVWMGLATSPQIPSTEILFWEKQNKEGGGLRTSTEGTLHAAFNWTVEQAPTYS